MEDQLAVLPLVRIIDESVFLWLNKNFRKSLGEHDEGMCRGQTNQTVTFGNVRSSVEIIRSFVQMIEKTAFLKRNVDF